MNLCFGCGEDNPQGLQLGPLTRIEDGEVRISYRVAEHFAGFEGVVHGGVIATILDEAMGLAITRTQDAKGAMTVSLNVEFKAPVRTDTPIEVRARAVREAGKFFCSSEILNPEGGVLARGESLWILPGGV